MGGARRGGGLLRNDALRAAACGCYGERSTWFLRTNRWALAQKRGVVAASQPALRATLRLASGDLLHAVEGMVRRQLLRGCLLLLPLDHQADSDECVAASSLQDIRVSR